MARITTQLAPITLALALAACGDGGGGNGGVASTPAPIPASAALATSAATRTPLPPTPATTTGNYQSFAAYTSYDSSGLTLVRDSTGRVVSATGAQDIVAPMQLAPQGSVSLAVDAATRTYTLSVDAGPYQFPTGRMTLPADTPLGFSRNNPDLSGGPVDWVARGDMLASTVTAGTAASGASQVITSFLRLYNAGQLNGSPRYLSAAAWGQFYQENASGIPGPENYKATRETTGILVFGQRTAPGDMPVSGQASYTVHSLISPPVTDEDGNVFDALGDTVLQIDFATKSLSGRYDWKGSGDTFKTDADGNTVYDDAGDPIVAEHSDAIVHAAGSTLVGNDGGFNLVLAGTGTLHLARPEQPPVADLVQPVTGSLTGAFFGPQAAEVGGIAKLPQMAPDGTVSHTFNDFAGLRAVP
ncbi:MAG: hypothetical protein JF593_05050 [Novosphingobium sp.]|nr:hypothetical protein [Novosphingobium sp.]